MPTTLHRGDRFGGADDFVVASEDEAVREMPARGRAISEGKWRVQRASLDLLASLDEEMARRKLDYDALACVASPDVETLRGEQRRVSWITRQGVATERTGYRERPWIVRALRSVWNPAKTVIREDQLGKLSSKGSATHSRRLVRTCSGQCLLARGGAIHKSLHW